MRVLVPDTWLERLETAARERGEADLEFVAYGEDRPGPFAGAEVFFWAWPSSDRRKALKAAPDVAWIQAASAGVNGVAPIAAERGVTLTESGDCYRVIIGEFVLALMLHHACRLREHGAATRARAWEGFRHAELDGKTCGIVGLGPIGLGVAERAAAFGMRIVGCRRSGEAVENVTDVVGPDDLGRLLARSDYVVLACPLTDETRGMIDRSAFGAMREGTVLVNIARGAVVETAALQEALESGRLAAAYLDVTDPEPLPADHPLWRLPNVFVTAHCAGGGESLRDRITDRLFENLGRYRRGEPLLGLVDLARGY